MSGIDKAIIRLDKPKIFNQEQNKLVISSDYIAELLSCYIGLEIVSQNEKELVEKLDNKLDEIRNLL